MALSIHNLDRIERENNELKNYEPIYQKKERKKYPTNSFYNLVTKKMSRFNAIARGLRIVFRIVILIHAQARRKEDSKVLSISSTTQ
jgi:hypothetical protein